MEALFFMLGVFLVVVTVCIVAIIKYSSSINRINEILIQHSKDIERNFCTGHDQIDHIHQRLTTVGTSYDQRIASTSAKIDSCYDKLSLKIDNSRNELIEYVNRDFVIKK